MLGKGWFPDQLGGLNRYYRGLILALPEAQGLLVGPARDAPSRVEAVGSHGAGLGARLTGLVRSARSLAADAELIDAHFALYALPALVLPRLRRAPLVAHFHGPWAEENVAVGDRSRLRHGLRHGLEAAVYRRADLAVSLTGAFRRQLVEGYGVSPWRTAVIAPGVDVEAFSPGDRAAARASLGVPATGFVACCARRLVPRMGIDVLLRAWARELAGTAEAHLLVAGEGEERGRLERLVAELGLQDSVRLLGRIGEAELLTLYRAADVNVVPSLALEGFGLVVLEAAACGTPSIVTDAGGLPEAIAGLGASLVVPAGDAEALADRLARAREGDVPDRAATRAWAEARDWESVAAAHRRLYTARISPRGPDRPKVVVLDHTAKLSGGELALVRLLPVLDVEAHVILAEDGPLVARLHAAGISVEVMALPERTRGLHRERVSGGALPLRAALDTIRYTVRLACRLRRLAPDVVHANSLKAGVYGTSAARLAGIPAVWHVRDRIATDYLPRPAVVLVRALTRVLPTVVVTNSETTRLTLPRRVNSVVVPSPISSPAGSGRPESAPAERPADDATPFEAVMVGRLAAWKGQDVFLRAFARAFPDGPETARIVGGALFGADELAYAESLEALARELGLAERVVFRGHRDDVGAELREAGCLVHASLTPEPFGQVVLEGMAAGLPVIASRGGGPAEIITDGADGLLFTPGSEAELAERLQLVAGDPALRARLGDAGRARAREFAPERAGERMIAAYALALTSAPSWHRGRRGGRSGRRGGGEPRPGADSIADR